VDWKKTCWSATPPSLGSTIYVRDHRQTNKLRPRYFKAVLLGWQPLSTSIIKYYDSESRKFGFSRDVVFDKPNDVDGAQAVLDHVSPMAPNINVPEASREPVTPSTDGGDKVQDTLDKSIIDLTDPNGPPQVEK
jgi:hypothetical protein